MGSHPLHEVFYSGFLIPDTGIYFNRVMLLTFLEKVPLAEVRKEYDRQMEVMKESRPEYAEKVKHLATLAASTGFDEGLPGVPAAYFQWAKNLYRHLKESYPGELKELLYSSGYATGEILSTLTITADCIQLQQKLSEIPQLKDQINLLGENLKNLKFTFSADPVLLAAKYQSYGYVYDELWKPLTRYCEEIEQLKSAETAKIETSLSSNLPRFYADVLETVKRLKATGQ